MLQTQTQFIEHEKLLDFVTNERPPSYWRTKEDCYELVAVNYILSRDPIGKLSIPYLILFHWELVFIAGCIDIGIIMSLSIWFKVVMTLINKAVENFCSKFLGWFFGLSAAFTFGFIVFSIIKSGLWQKLYEWLVSLWAQ